MSRISPRQPTSSPETSALFAEADPLVVLAGGLGTRLRSAVPDLPKVMAPIAGRPFLAWLLDALARQGVGACVLSLGFRADAVLAWLDDNPKPSGIEVTALVEPKPLGTGGALRYVCERMELSGSLRVLNGDSYLDGGYADLAAHPGEAVLTTVEVEDTSRYGRVETDADGRVTGFKPKGTPGRGRINAGLYRLPVADLTGWPNDQFSVEQDLMPDLVAQRRLQAVAIAARFIDIGVPSDYNRFDAMMRSRQDDPRKFGNDPG